MGKKKKSLPIVLLTEVNTVVHVNNTVLPPPVPRELEGWIVEMFAYNVGTSCDRNTSVYSNLSGNSNISVSREQQMHSSCLLFFQELVMVIVMQVSNCWDKEDCLYKEIAQSIMQILTYTNVVQDCTWADHQWGRESKNIVED